MYKINLRCFSLNECRSLNCLLEVNTTSIRLLCIVSTVAFFVLNCLPPVPFFQIVSHDLKALIKDKKVKPKPQRVIPIIKQSSF